VAAICAYLIFEFLNITYLQKWMRIFMIVLCSFGVLADIRLWFMYVTSREEPEDRVLDGRQ
jgi:hypothetical protein